MTPSEATTAIRRTQTFSSFTDEYFGISIFEEMQLDQRLIEYYLSLNRYQSDTWPTLVSATSAMVRDLPLSKRLSLDREYYPELYI